MEVDFILGDLGVALEIKGSRRVHEGDLKGLRSLLSEHRAKHALLVAQEKAPRVLDDRIRAVPWRDFLRELWAGELGV